jgi:hypothetical protein
MPWACANCGSETSRSRSTFEPSGELKQEVCPHCSPESFDGVIHMPTDLKLWPGPAAMPNLYKRGKDDVYRAKDELISDTVAGWDRGPEEERKERKRALRRTEPLTSDELRAAIRWGNECLKPMLESERNSN